jgi:hypothetical protein
MTARVTLFIEESSQGLTARAASYGARRQFNGPEVADELMLQPWTYERKERLMESP